MDSHRYRIIVEYDGSEFSGWQWQPNRRTVQGVLEDILERIFHEKIRVHGAGRTDAGVHARGQVVHFDAPTRLPPGKLKLALNGNAPSDVRINDLAIVAYDFHARYTATWRWYRYRLFRCPRAVERQFGWYPKSDVQAELLQEAAKLLIGEHDFRGFSCLTLDELNRPYEGKCRVEVAGWELSAEEFRFHIVGNRFLRHMVRGLVGAMVELAQGRFDLAFFSHIFETRHKPNDIYNAPPQGLCLMHVGYGEYPFIEPNSQEVVEAYEILH